MYKCLCKDGFQGDGNSCTGTCDMSHALSRVSCLVSRVSCLVSRVSCLVSRVSCLVSRVSCLVSRVSCLVSRVSCLVSRVMSCLVSTLASCVLSILFPIALFAFPSRQGLGTRNEGLWRQRILGLPIFMHAVVLYTGESCLLLPLKISLFQTANKKIELIQNPMSPAKRSKKRYGNERVAHYLSERVISLVLKTIDNRSYNAPNPE